MKTRPDAVKFPKAAVPPLGGAVTDEAVAVYAEGLLAVDLDGDEWPRCYCQGDWYFCARSTLDGFREPGPTLLAADGSGRPRYTWTAAPDEPEGVELGTLIDEQ